MKRPAAGQCASDDLRDQPQSALGATYGIERELGGGGARLQHPHILPVLDSGEADGLLDYVMPLVTGETLRAWLAALIGSRAFVFG